MRPVCCLLLVLALRPAEAAERLLLDAAADATYWSTARGAEFPGATVALAIVDDGEAGKCLEADCAFTAESRYAGAEWRGTAPEAAAIGARIKPSHAGYLDIRFQDATGQWLMKGQNVKGGQWNDVMIDLAGPLSNHWAGANDGVLHFPLQRILIAVPRKPDRQTLRIQNLHAVVENIPAEQRWSLLWQPGGASGVVFPGQEATYHLSLVNRTDSEASAALTVTSEAIDGEPVEKLRETRTVPGWSALAWDLPFETERLGYRIIRATLDRSPVNALSGLVVVPPARHYGQKAPNAYFGLQLIGDMEAAERLGCKAVRHFLFWRFSEGTQGRIVFDEPHMDPAVDSCGRHNMDMMLTLCLRSPTWIAWKREDKPKAASLPDPARAGEWTKFCREMAEHYRDREWVTTIEIENEPDLTCVSHAELSIEEGIDYYAKMLRAGHAGLKQGNPDVVVAGSGVSGGDMDRGLPFTKGVLTQAADFFDRYAAHPYASPRNFGPGQHPKWPKANRLAEKCEEALTTLAAAGKERRMWIGELGWALKVDADPASRYSLDYAACVAQSLVTAKSVPGVERYLHFTLRGANESGYEYGLLRGDPAWPLPAAAMYAAAAWHLEDAQPVARRDVGDKLRVATFAHQGRQELIAVFMADDEANAVQLPDNAPAGVWSDSLFRDLTPSDGKVAVGTMPVYWTVPLSSAAAQPDFLTTLRQVPARLVELQDVRLSRLDRLAVRAVNHTAQAQPVAVTVDGRVTNLILPAGAGVQELAVPLPQAVPLDQTTTLAVTLLAGGTTIERQVTTTPTALPAGPAIEVDGDLKEWTGPGWVVDQKRDVLPPDPNVGWNDAADLSLRVHLAASAKGFGLGVTVTDDVHHVGRSDPGRFWQSDSLQIAIDPLNDGGDAFDPQDRELGLVLGEDGPYVFITYPGNPRVLTVPVSIVRTGTTTVYEALVPWAAMNLKAPEPGRIVATNVVANDNDGQGRAYWMGLTPGIGEAKTPAAYREFAVAGR